jgi:hypothetical protein
MVKSTVVALEAALSADALDVALERGRRTTLDDAVSLALSL